MIYLVEDDESIRKFVIYALNSSGLEAKGFFESSEFWTAMKTKIPQLVLLDIMLPSEDGLSVLSKIRSRSETERLPVIMLTAKSTEYDKVIGLDAGADDYIAKPFGTMELISRIKALLRRTNEVESIKEYKIGKLYLCPQKHIVRVDNKDVVLSFKEFELLCLLVADKGVVFSREHILQRIWGYDYDGENRTVDVHIKTLRAKLGEAQSIIKTVRGIGYKVGEDND